MKCTTKNVLPLLTVCALTLCFALCSVSVSALSIGPVKCGENTTLTLEDEYILTISGYGPTWDFDGIYPNLWVKYADTIGVIIVGNNVTAIGNDAFAGLWNVHKLTIGKHVTSIGDNAFADCHNLSEITIPASVTSIGSNAFCGCADVEKYIVEEGNPAYVSEDGVLFNKDKTVLIQYPAAKKDTSYTVPDSVVTICDNAFYQAENLTEVTIPASVNSIGKTAFFWCTGLEKITVDASNENYMAQSGILFTKDQSELILYPAGKTDTSCSIPETVTVIHEKAFAWATKLKVITVPTSVISIGESAFYGCESLNSVNIPEGVTEIAPNTFLRCFWLKEIIIPESVVSIGARAFNYCRNLTSVTIPANISSIGDESFSGCTKLSSATVLSASVSFGTDVFYGTAKDFTIRCSKNSTATAYAEENDFDYSWIDDSLFLLGDLDQNGTVDLSDAHLLFQHSMMPDLYPVHYAGNLDFTKDGVVDISDAMLLFRYSMMPDIYPIG